jgi:hypothetical protein
MKNIKCIWLLPVICICLFVTCTSKIEEKKFFDVPGYIKNEIKSIKNSESTIIKTSVYNSDTAYQSLSTKEVNWNKEFAIFLETDINKPIYYANMTVNSENSTHKTTYQAKSGKLNIQKVVVENGPDTHKIIEIEINKNNLISVTKIHALYIPDSLYIISGEQTIKNLGDQNTFFVKGEFN